MPADVDPRDVDAIARRAARLRKQYPRWAAWIVLGAPPVRSEAEHVELFGCAYKRGELT